MWDKKQISQVRFQKLGVATNYRDITDFMDQRIAIQSQAHQPAVMTFLTHVENSNIDTIQMHYDDRTLIKLWGNRFTLHTYLASDWELIAQVFSTRLGVMRNLAKNAGLDIDVALAKVDAYARTKQMVSREELQEVIGCKDKQIVYGVLAQATMNGILYLLPTNDLERIYQHRMYLGDYREWRLDGDEQSIWLSRLLLRYLVGYGPATIADFAYWSGIALTPIRKALKLLHEECMEIEVEDTVYYLVKSDYQQFASLEQGIYLTGKFDQAILSYKDMSWIVDPCYKPHIMTKNGHCEALIIVDSRIVGIWRRVKKGKQMAIEVTYFGTEQTLWRPIIEAQLNKLVNAEGFEVQEIFYMQNKLS